MSFPQCYVNDLNTLKDFHLIHQNSWRFGFALCMPLFVLSPLFHSTPLFFPLHSSWNTLRKSDPSSYPSWSTSLHTSVQFKSCLKLDYFPLTFLTIVFSDLGYCVPWLLRNVFLDVFSFERANSSTQQSLLAFISLDLVRWNMLFVSNK